MKRVVLAFLVFLVVFGMFAAQGPKTVSAIKGTPPSTVVAPIPLAPNNWSDGNETTVDMTKYPAPSWLELLANPVVIASSEKVYHEFRGGQYDWVPVVKQLKDGKWTLVESTAGWTPNTEGKYMVCFKAEPGTYALFGYYSTSVK
jgi:hypothetical protein